MTRNLPTLARDAQVWASRTFNTSLAPPDWVTLNVTLRCNLSCLMCTTCYDSPELSRQQIFDLIDQVSAWGVKVLNLLGGEPFARDDLVDVLEYASRRDLYITVTTNGTLIDDDKAERIARIAYNRLHFNVSIDGFKEVHDHIRGKGMFERAVQGFQRLRRADQAQGQAPRKILVNSVVNDLNLDQVPAFLDWARGMGFSGVQLLNLFKHGHEVPREIKHMWIPRERWAALDEVVEQVKAWKAAVDPVEFEVVNSPHQLDIMKLYYRERLPPRLAPCFAGWKELYINADGRGIMCDGKLDFLNGQFGDVRAMTLRQMWESAELASRREVVKACTSPCIQDCYLRESSDSMFKIARGVGRVLAEELNKRLRPPPRWVPLPGTALTLELSDVSDLPAPWELGRGGERLAGLTAGCAVPFERVYEDPFLYYEYRNQGMLNFNRGFMGFELIQRLGEDLRRTGQRFEELRLGWRGEVTLHPEFSRILTWAMERTRAGSFGQVRLETHGALLNTEYVDAAVDGGAPQRWIVHLDAATPETWARLRGRDLLAQVERNLGYLLSRRRQSGRPDPQLVVALTALAENEEEVPSFVERWQRRLREAGLSPALWVGELPERGDGIWIRRQDCESFLPQLEARQRLERVAALLGVEGVVVDRDRGAPPRCASPFKTPTISWDGKVTLCTWDRTLMLRAGEITVEELSEIWWSKDVPREARQAVASGTLHQRLPCRDCPFPFSPNAPTLTDEELQRHQAITRR